MDKRLFPITHEFFNFNIKPLIDSSYSRAGRPQSISDYNVFCAMLYVLRTGIPWRDLPKCYGHWHRVYQRFKRSSDRGVWWKIVLKLQSDKKISLNIVLADSTTFKVHRHGGGLKGGSKVREKTALV
jgi:transposase